MRDITTMWLVRDMGVGINMGNTQHGKEKLTSSQGKFPIYAAT